ncbi:MAG: hypothetical protein KDD11_04815 [Acidobacteria bacterium]|nr:hypothetical protein [Acidobacteriota bacterium]
MAHVPFTEALANEYRRLFAECEILPQRFDEVDRVVDRAVAEKARYEAVVAGLGIPWHFVAAVHSLESSQSFDDHLHNGDPLTARTVNVPAGRPPEGDPPFEWEESARDALVFERLDRVEGWGLARELYQLEAYNGFGYRVHHPEVLSPYLWSFTNLYTRGKYLSDGRFSPTAVSKQCGAAAILRRLVERGEIDLGPEPPVAEPVFRFDADAIVPEVFDLQRFLNGFPGVALRVDGKAGPKTSSLVERFFGHRLKGDPEADE